MSNWKSYELNVAVITKANSINPAAPTCQHYCRVILPDYLDDLAAAAVAREIADRFGEGYVCELSRQETKGYRMDLGPTT